MSTSPDFAAKWLVHRLGRFTKAHPEIDIRVSAAPHHVDYAREEVDLAVRHGEGTWSGLRAVCLSAEQLFCGLQPGIFHRTASPQEASRRPLFFAVALG